METWGGTHTRGKNSAGPTHWGGCGPAGESRQAATSRAQAALQVGGSSVQEASKPTPPTPATPTWTRQLMLHTQDQARHTHSCCTQDQANPLMLHSPRTWP